MSADEVGFGKYVETIRLARRKSLRGTAHAIGVSPQYYSEVEKGRRCAFTADRLEALEKFLELTPEESVQMYNKAAESYSGKNVAVPQDFTKYIVERDYVMAALRTMKEMDADEKDWQQMVQDFIARKKGENA
ncbi:MAG: helix-turn-helix transcriptional regulator [Synergistaceae bacterium]|nr:helix-turn-helix transcriptional regulator [Synergistaceae bacterium]MBR0185576.1 helix-turn-helix transcriptional regulator [Synergistaceae bacterium]